MKIKDLLIESKNIRSVFDKKIHKDAVFFRKSINKEKEKIKNRDLKDIKKSQKEHDREIKKSIINKISSYKKESKDKNSFLDFVLSFKNQIDDDLYDFIKFVAFNSDKLKTKSSFGTMLITRNQKVLDKIFKSKIINDYMNDKIKNLISKFYRISNPSINEKLKNNIFLDYRAINNSVFNIIKDIIFELIKCNLLSKEGL